MYELVFPPLPFPSPPDALIASLAFSNAIVPVLGLDLASSMLALRFPMLTAATPVVALEILTGLVPMYVPGTA